MFWEKSKVNIVSMSTENSPSRRWVQQQFIKPRLTADGKWQIGMRPKPNLKETHQRMKDTEEEFEEWYKELKRLLNKRNSPPSPNGSEVL